MVILINQNVGWLNIAMQNFSTFAPLVGNSIVAVLECKQKLVAYLPYDFFLNIGHILFGFLQLCSEIAPRTVLHYDVNLRIRLVDHPINVAHYVWVL